MNTDQTVDYLNTIVKTKLAPSPIHAVGVFAIRDIPKGTKMFLIYGPKPYRVSPGNQAKLFTEVLDTLKERWPRMLQGEGFLYPDAYTQGYMNHADEPNYDATLDITLREIKAGEEVTEDYRLIPCWEQAFPWLVGDKI